MIIDVYIGVDSSGVKSISCHHCKYLKDDIKILKICFHENLMCIFALGAINSICRTLTEFDHSLVARQAAFKVTTQQLTVCSVTQNFCWCLFFSPENQPYSFIKTKHYITNRQISHC